MTATLEGQRALRLTEGYQHHDRWQLFKEASRGCPLCVIIFTYCGTSWKKDTRASLRFIGLCTPDETIDQVDKNTVNGGYPFESQKLYAIRTTESSPRFARLYAFTGPGKNLL